jgi:subtilisin family serine protease
MVSAFMSVSIRASELVTASDGPSAKIVEYVPGELLVKYKPAVRSVASEYFRSRWGVATIRTFKKIGVQHVRLPKDMTVEEALEIYRSDPDVEYAEPNYLRYKSALPNDIFFDNLWGLHNTGQTGGTPDADIDAPEAWDITPGSSNIVVAVLDSGVDYNHPDLAANIWINPGEIAGNGIDDDSNGYIDDVKGWDFVDDDNDPVDSDDHGTHVAGTVAAVGNNNTGITGVSWTAKIMVLRFLNAFGVGEDADAISAIEYANVKGAHIINNSWGGGGFNQFLKDAIDASSAVVVCAAGNDGDNNDSAPFYPSSYTSSNIIAIAATDQDDSHANFSNYGATSVDVAAPGTNIFSSRPDRQMVWSDDFESGLGSWTTNKVSGKDWGLTAALSFSPSNSLTDSQPPPDNNYDNNTDSWAITPVLNLSLYTGTKLEFKLNGSSEAGFDFLYVQTSTDSLNWTDQDIFVGNTVFSRISGTSSGAWFSAFVDLGAYDGNGTVYIRFRFTSDDTIVGDGWYIDDVSVTAAENTYLNPQDQYYQYFNGTSMATPHVSGLAALLLADNPGLSAIQVKERILIGAEVKSGLAGMILTGGRINAYNSIRNVPAAPSSLSAAAVSSSQINLTWSDNSFGEDGFRIERKMDVGGVYTQVATTAANATTYSDTGLDKSTTYYYRIRSYNGINTSDFSADTSATTSATTSSSGGGGGGPCFIATAAFGLPLDGLAN